MNKPLIVKQARIRNDTNSVEVSDGTIVHPEAEIWAKNGPIIIGKNNLIEERTKIINELPTPMIIGDNNVFEVGTECRAKVVGNNCTFCVQTIISDQVTIGSHCIFAPRSKVTSACHIEDCTSVTGQNAENWITLKSTQPDQQQQLDYLKGILPKYHFFQQNF